MGRAGGALEGAEPHLFELIALVGTPGEVGEFAGVVFEVEEEFLEGILPEIGDVFPAVIPEIDIPVPVVSIDIRAAGDVGALEEFGCDGSSLKGGVEGFADQFDEGGEEVDHFKKAGLDAGLSSEASGPMENEGHFNNPLQVGRAFCDAAVIPAGIPVVGTENDQGLVEDFEILQLSEDFPESEVDARDHAIEMASVFGKGFVGKLPEVARIAFSAKGRGQFEIAVGLHHFPGGVERGMWSIKAEV